MTSGNGKLPNWADLDTPFPSFADERELKDALAKRLDPPREMTPSQMKRWRQKAMERDSDVYVENLMLLGMRKHHDPVFREAVSAARSNALAFLKTTTVERIDPIFEKVTKGGGLISAQCERFDFRPLDVVDGVNFDAANLRASEWSDMEVRNCRFAQADFSRACLHRAVFDNCDFTTADLSGAYMRGALFNNCRLPASILRWSRGKNSIWTNCDLRQADVAFADFLGARFWQCNLLDVRHEEYAVFVWYRAGDGSGRMEYRPTPGFVRQDSSRLGSESVQENSARRKVDG